MAAEPDHPYEIVDVFTDTPLHGNPLAVFTAGDEVPSRLMQAAARELHLSETVFVLSGDDEADATIRIFTPDVELPFAGHPVLGTAFIVGERQNLATVRLRTGVGIVPVRLTRVVRRPRVRRDGSADPHGERLRASGRAAQRARSRGGPGGADRVLRQRSGAPDRRAARPGGGGGARARHAGAGAARGLPDELLRAGRRRCQDSLLRAIARRQRGSGDRLSGWAAGAAPRASRADPGSGRRFRSSRGPRSARPSHLQARVEGSRDVTEGVVVGGSRRAGRPGTFPPSVAPRKLSPRTRAGRKRQPSVDKFDPLASRQSRPSPRRRLNRRRRARPDPRERPDRRSRRQLPYSSSSSRVSSPSKFASRTRGMFGRVASDPASFADPAKVVRSGRVQWLAITRSIRPYSAASSALKNRSRSMSA